MRASAASVRAWHAEFPEGARVHHCNQVWTFGWTEQERRANPQWGWGKIVRLETRYAEASGRRADLELLVQPDDGTEARWWPGWAIDEVHRG